MRGKAPRLYASGFRPAWNVCGETSTAGGGGSELVDRLLAIAMIARMSMRAYSKPSSSCNRNQAPGFSSVRFTARPSPGNATP